MSKEKVFTNGFVFKIPHPNAPSFVKGKVSVKVEDFKKFLDEHNDNGWVNIDLKLSQEGKPYAELDTWKPEKADTEKSSDSSDSTGDIPF